MKGRLEINKIILCTYQNGAEELTYWPLTKDQIYRLSCIVRGYDYGFRITKLK